MKKFEAVSGDQSLFDLVGASDDELFIIKLSHCNGITSTSVYSKGYNVIAERRPVEKYIPKAGDVSCLKSNPNGEMLCLKSNDHGVAFEYLEGEKKGLFDSISTSAEFLFIRKHSVNEDNWKPKNGESFRVGGILYHKALQYGNGNVRGFTDVFGAMVAVAHHASTIFEKP